MKKQILFFAMGAAIMCGCTSSNKQTNAMTDNSNLNHDSLTLVIGSYAQSNEEGIKVYSFNQSTADFAFVSSITGISNPSFLVQASDKRRFYSVGEDEGKSASAFALNYNPENKSLSILNSQKTNGGAPCNILASDDMKYVFTANYGGGNLSVFKLDSAGLLMPVTTVEFKGNGPDKERQAGPHIHSVNITPDGKYLWANDLGSDRVRVLDMTAINSMCASSDMKSGENNPDLENNIVHDDKNDIVLPEGTGPRHTCFTDDGRFAYIISELSGEVIALKYNGSTKPEIIQTVKADTVDARGSADIHLSPDNKYLYASCRLKADGVAVFRVDSINGSLQRVGYQLTGKHPRNFTITPNGKFLLVACRDENAVEVYSRNTQTGMLEYTGKKIEMKAPVCLQWVK